MRYIVLLLLTLNLYGVDATLTIEKDVDQRAKIVVVDASGVEGAGRSKTIWEIFRADLRISGHFLPDARYRRGTMDAPVPLKLRGSDYLLRYRYRVRDGEARLDLKVLKGGSGRSVFEKHYRIDSALKYPFLVHRAVTDFNAVAGFAPIDWINRYVLLARYTGRKESEIMLADYTFHFKKTIVKGGLNLFPVWADTAQHSFYYSDYNTKEPVLYRLNIYTGQRTRIVSSQGMLVCSDVSADGRKLLLTMAPSGQPDIYEYSLDSGKARRLTRFGGIDVNGKYADKERTLVFVSNRLGYPNIFKKAIAGGAVTQLVYHGSNNSSCDTHDDKVVYSSREKKEGGGSRFNLYVTHTDGSGTRPLTSGGINQFPRFSPDGNTVLYIKRSYSGNAVGYLGLQTNLSLLFPMGDLRIQSIDW